MSKYLLAGAAAAAMVAIAPAIAQTAQPAPAPVIEHVVHVAPKAHSRAEVATHVRTMFERLDANRDGFVTKAEAQAGKAQLGARHSKRMRHPGTARGEHRAANRGAMFERLDTNRDGSLSRAEFEAAPRREERRIVLHGGKPGGVVGAHGRPGMRGMRMGMGMGLGGRMFDMADANRDGRVSLQEATAAAYRHFDTADSNRDGRVTREERIQVRQRIRAERRPG